MGMLVNASAAFHSRHRANCSSTRAACLDRQAERDDCWSRNEFNRWLIVPHSAILFVGRCFNESVVLLSWSYFHSEAVFLLRPHPSFSCPHWNCINTLLSGPSLLSHSKKTEVFSGKKGSPAVPKFAVRNYSFVVAAENQRCILTCLLICPINWILAGFLAAASGSCEDNADLGKWPFFSAAYLLRWQNSRNHNWWNIIKTNPQNRLMISFSAGSFPFKSLICLSFQWKE